MESMFLDGLSLQLDWSWIAEWAYAGILLWLSDFKTKTSFGFLVKKGVVFFKKSKNELVQQKLVFLAILAKIRSFSDNSDM